MWPQSTKVGCHTSFTLCYLHVDPAHRVPLHSSCVTRQVTSALQETFHWRAADLTEKGLLLHPHPKTASPPLLWYLCDAASFRILWFLSEKRHLGQLRKQEHNYISQRETLPMVCLSLQQTISSFNAFQHLFKSVRNGLLLRESYKKLRYLALTNPKASESHISEIPPI